MGEQKLTDEHWTKMIEKQFEEAAGDEQDRWTTLIKQFRVNQQADVFEEYDGVNNESANQLILVISFPLLVRGHAIQTRVHDDIITVRVPNLYKLTLGLPCSILENLTHSYFDCKIRKLIITMPVRRIAEINDDLQPEDFLRSV